METGVLIHKLRDGTITQAFMDSTTRQQAVTVESLHFLLSQVEFPRGHSWDLSCSYCTMQALQEEFCPSLKLLPMLMILEQIFACKIKRLTVSFSNKILPVFMAGQKM